MNTLRIICARLVLCLLCACLLASCRLPWKQAHSHNNLANLPKPTAQQLLATLQKNFRAVKTFHVLMQVQNAGTASSDQIQIRSANGDILMPDKIKAQATVIMSGQSMSINLISVGADEYITDPITGQWRQVKGVLDPRTLTNPNSGIISLIGKVQKVSDPVSDSINNVPCWRIQGQLPAQDLAFFTGGGMPAGTQLQTSACVGKGDLLPYLVTVTGQASPSDTAQTSRSFLLSNYNQNVSIAAPQL